MPGCIIGLDYYGLGATSGSSSKSIAFSSVPPTVFYS